MNNEAIRAHELATKFSSENNNEQSLVKLRQVVERGENPAQLWELLGVQAFEAADYPLALFALEHASVYKPLGRQAQLALARCYIDAKHREAATAIALHLATAAEVAVEMLEPLASCLGQCGLYEAALDVCRQASQRMPENPDPLIGIAHYMRRLRRPVEVILPVMFQAHHFDPENMETRVTLAWMLHESGRSEEGAYLLEQVPLKDFNCIRCLTLMKHVFEKVGDVQRQETCGVRLKVLAGEWPDGCADPTVLE